MANQPEFDLQLAHRYFAANCFNRTWDFIDNKDRTEEQTMEMLHTAMASLWHWDQRSDAKAQNLSVGNWQVSRVYVLLGQADNARRYGAAALKLSEGCEPFYTAFAYEALARAEMLAGNKAGMNEYLAKAKALAEQVEDVEDKAVLQGDLATIK